MTTVPVSSNSSAARWTGGFLFIWFAAALAAGASGVLTTLPRGVPQAVAVGLGVAIALAAGLSAKLKAWVDSIPVNVLVALHITRAPVGAILVWLGASGYLSPVFGTRAGVGDVVVGLGATWLVLSGAASASRRPVYLLWNLLGLADFAIVLVTAAQVASQAVLPGVRPLLHLPLSLLPTFAVPFLIATHFTLFRRIRELGG